MKTFRLACLVASVMLLPTASWAGGGRSVEPFDPGLKVFGKTYSVPDRKLSVCRDGDSR